LQSKVHVHHKAFGSQDTLYFLTSILHYIFS